MLDIPTTLKTNLCNPLSGESYLQPTPKVYVQDVDSGPMDGMSSGVASATGSIASEADIKKDFSALRISVNGRKPTPYQAVGLLTIGTMCNY